MYLPYSTFPKVVTDWFTRSQPIKLFWFKPKSTNTTNQFQTCTGTVINDVLLIRRSRYCVVHFGVNIIKYLDDRF